MIPLKEQVHLLSEQLRKSGSPEVAGVVKLLELHIEEIKDKLVHSSGDDMLYKQGAARNLRQIVQALTEAPIGAKLTGKEP